MRAVFREGAGAVFSKNMLLMKKTGNFLRKQDMFLIVFYFVISMLAVPEHTFPMFCYMMIFWMFKKNFSRNMPIRSNNVLYQMGKHIVLA